MERISIYFSLIFIIGSFCTGPVSAQIIPVPTQIIRVVEGKVNLNSERGGGFPIIDGKLDDRSWEKASVISGFNGVDGRRDEVDQQTRVYLMYNDQEAWHGKGSIRLYFGFKNDEIHMDKLERIGGYFHDEFISNREAINQTRDSREAFFTVNGIDKFPYWEYQHSFSEDYWSEERACFVEEIIGGELSEGDKIAGETVMLHLARRNGIVNESSSWNGKLVFGEATDPVCRISSFGELTAGESAVDFEVINNNTSSVTLNATIRIFPLSEVKYLQELYRLKKLDSLVLSSEPYAFSNQLKLKGREQKKFDAKYSIKEEGEHYLTYTLSDPKDRTIYYRTGFLFSVAKNKEKLAELKMRLEGLKKNIPTSPENIKEGLNEANNLLVKSHEGLERKAKKTQAPGNWNSLTESVNELDKKVAKLGHKIKSYKALAQDGNSGLSYSWDKLEYGIGIETNLTKLRRDKPFTGDICNKVEISACGNEYEGFQLVILPFEKDLTNISVKVTDLINKQKNSRINSENIEINAVDYVETKIPTYEVEYVGWWPDPLVPMEKPYFSDVKADHLLQPIWINVYVPANTPHGKYEGELTVSFSNAQDQKVKVMVTVRDFNISTTPHIKEFFRLSTWSFAPFYGKEMTEEKFREWSAFQLKHRIGQPSQSFGKVRNADGSYDYSISDKNIAYSIEHGMNVFDLGFASVRNLTVDGIEEALDQFIDYSNHLKEKGLFEYALVEPLNEVSADVTKPFYTKLKKAVPEIKILQKGEGGDYHEPWSKGEKSTLEGVLDIWCPDYVPPSSWDPAIKERHEAGEQCWAYHDYVNCVIDRPAINLRKIHWRAWARNLDGLAYWSTTNWVLNTREDEPLEDKWPNSPWHSMSHSMGNGDGHFIYPGPDMKPLSSFRLENLRDAQEDYEYLYTLRELTDELRNSDKEKNQELISESEKLLDIDKALSEPVTTEMLYQLRNRIALQIENIKASIK